MEKTRTHFRSRFSGSELKLSIIMYLKQSDTKISQYEYQHACSGTMFHNVINRHPCVGCTRSSNFRLYHSDSFVRLNWIFACSSFPDYIRESIKKCGENNYLGPMVSFQWSYFYKTTQKLRLIKSEILCFFLSQARAVVLLFVRLVILVAILAGLFSSIWK